jgi:hypothetical protein
MKRCPQCEFLYEDEQSLCDMDGILLVYDSRQLPHLQAIATTTTQLPGKSSRKRVPALATMVLVSVLGLVYYVSTQRYANQAVYTPAAATTSNPVVNAVPTPENQAVQSNSTVSEGAKAEDSGTNASEAPKSTGKASSSSTEAGQNKQVPKPKAAPVRSSVQPESQEKDSKVGSFFKKTGRILKKPFKF